MRFLIRNCLKYAQQCQNGLFKKICWATTVLIQLGGSPLSTMEVWESPNT